MSIRLAYLCGEYPRATDTFIQREVKSLRKAGLNVETISVRRPALLEQGTEEQHAERQNTHYLLPCSPWRLFSDHITLLWNSPARYIRSIWQALTIRSPGFQALLYQLFYFAEAGLVATRMKRQRLTHIHNHAPDSSGYVCMLASELSGVTYSMTLHGFGILSEPRRWRLKEKIERSLFTICVSYHARSQAMLWADRSAWKKLHIVHCGIEAKDEIAIRNHTGKGTSILFVGRFDHVKGLPVLLEAFATLANQDRDIHLNLVGDGPDRAELEKLVHEKNITEHVTFHGYRSQAEVRKFYQSADVFVMTSFVEGIPVVLMEAMFYGVPVVAPRITGIPELIIDGENGLLTTPSDVNSLSENIQRLLADSSLRNRFAIKGRNTVLKEFNLKNETTYLASVMRQYLSS